MKANPQRVLSVIKIVAIIGIAGVFFGFAAIQVVSEPEATKVSFDRSAIGSITTKASSFFSDVGRMPESIDDLLANARQLNGWKGPYLSEFQAKNPWGLRYIIRYPGKHSEIDVISLGADGLEGGTGYNADIGNWQ